MLETLPKWGRLYTVEADITVTKMPTGSINIFHFTQNGNGAYGVYGDRVPYVNIYKNGKFYIDSAVSGNTCTRTFHFDLEKKYHLKIQQFQRDDKIIYEVLINGKPIDSVENTEPKDFENVKVYVSDRWYASFTSEYGYLENFKYSRPFEGKKITENNGVHLVSAPNHTRMGQLTKKFLKPLCP